MLAVTPSKLSDYLLCGYKYKLKYVEKSAAGSNSPSPALAFGITMHSALQELHQPGKALPEQIDVTELLSKYWAASAYATVEEDEQYFLKGCQALAAYREAFINSSGDKTIGTEVYMSFIFKLGDLQVRLGCKADRICVHQDDTLEIIDYKTSASGKVPTPEFLTSDLATFIYYVLARTTYPDYKLVRISLLNVLTLARVSVEYSPVQVAANKKALFECVTSLSRNLFTASPSEACSWCQFQDVCTACNRVIDFSGIN